MDLPRTWNAHADDLAEQFLRYFMVSSLEEASWLDCCRTNRPVSLEHTSAVMVIYNGLDRVTNDLIGNVM